VAVESTSRLPNAGPSAAQREERNVVAAQQRAERNAAAAQRRAEQAAAAVAQAAAALAATTGAGAAFLAYQNLEAVVKRHYPSDTPAKIEEALASIKFDRARVAAPRLGVIQPARGRPIEVYRDWVLRGTEVHDVDATTRGHVHIDGSVQVTSAVVPRGSKGKTKVVTQEHDLRTAQLDLASASWSISVPIALNRVNETRRVVEQLMAHVGTLRPQAAQVDIGSVLNALLNNTGQPAAERIKQLSDLRYERLLSDEEFERAKAKILGI